jgi:YHS domain-containing protein
LIALIGIASCKNNRQDNTPPVQKDSTMTAPAAAKPDLKGLTFAYQKDPACGMPLKAGLEDTASYKGKLYGFCSKECKAEFLKSPDSYLANAK